MWPVPRAAEKASVWFCSGWECPYEILAHPNAPGWAQTIGALLSIWAAIWVAGGPTRQREKDREEAWFIVADTIESMQNAYETALEHLREPGKPAKLGVIQAAGAIIRSLCEDLKKMDASVLPDADLQIKLFTIRYLAESHIGRFQTALEQKNSEGSIHELIDRRLGTAIKDLAALVRQLDAGRRGRKERVRRRLNWARASIRDDELPSS